MEINWTKQEFQVYLLICCANADYKETKEEVEYIKANHAIENYDAIHAEYEKDSDYQRAQKIQAGLEKYNYTKATLQELIDEMKGLFMTDGKFDQMEKNLMIGLRHLVK